MKFDYDLFISFSDDDNQSVNDENGWISDFKTYLGFLLKYLLKRTPIIIDSSIFKDNSDINKNEIYSKTANFIIILSDNYIKSSACKNELNSIYEYIKNKYEHEYNYPVFKVLKSPITIDDKSGFIHKLTNHNFYEIFFTANETNKYITLEGKAEEKQYWIKLVDLSYDINKSYENILHQQTIKITDDTKRTVFLAETGIDQDNNREIIKRELQQHGYTVLPNHQLSTSDTDLKSDIQKDLQKSSLSIHIFGDDPGHIVKENNISIVEFQNNIAANYFNNLNKDKDNNLFSRIIWIAPDLKITDEKQKINIEKLKHNAEALTGAELVQTPIEVLKTIIHNRLKGKSIQNIDISDLKTTKEKNIYLIYDKNDTEYVLQVSELLSKKAYKPVSTEFEGNKLTLINQHRQKLVNCDCVVIFFFNSNINWLNSKLYDIKKAPGFGRKNHINIISIYSDTNNLKLLKKIYHDSYIIIKQDKKFDQNLFDPLFKKINQTI
ncbi:MAG: hypothetical protein KAT68_16940 [Bacteroidales bacterium]|nr:hypothetical protein [Bacteroidales bacterium]